MVPSQTGIHILQPHRFTLPSLFLDNRRIQPLTGLLEKSLLAVFSNIQIGNAEHFVASFAAAQDFDVGLGDAEHLSV